MNVLIACEESQTVCKAFRDLGIEAYSNDIQDCSGAHPEWHLKMDVFNAIKLKKWDLMIAHPPCTYLTYAGMKNWYDDGRAEKRITAAMFFMDLYNSNILYVCVENPRGIMSKIFRNPDQEIHPYYFGDKEMKRTCLWLKNLPKLNYQIQNDLFSLKTATTHPLPSFVHIRKKTGKLKKRYFVDGFTNEGIRTSKEKSKTFPSIARAMAEQWGNFLLNQ